MDALKEIAGLANHLRHGNVTLWAIADDEYCAEMGLTVEEQGETLSEFLHGVAERLDSEVRFTEGTSGKAVERADRYAEWLDDIEAELFGERIETFTHGDHERQSERISDILSVLENGAERLMPEGMGWPRYEDGEPVRTGDRFAEHGGCENVADSIEIGDCWFKIHGFDGAAPRYSKGAFVKRPAPKVLDADGVEIRVGDEVFVIATGKTHHVTVIDHIGKRFKSMEQMGDDATWLDPVCFTHRAPVLAADGRPLREGETVLGVDSGTRYTVEKVTDGFIPIKCRSEMGTTVSLFPLQLTHERPVADTWERLEKDANKAVCLYFGVNTKACSECAHNSWECSFDKDCDLVRRAKALAERGQ